MSSTNRGRVRNLDDAYLTPYPLAELICGTLRRDFSLMPARIVEPGCGDGSFIAACRVVWPDALIQGIELNPAFVDIVRHRFDQAPEVEVVSGDVLQTTFTKPDLVIGNPPFKHADRFISHCMEWLHPGGLLAFLLRLNFLGGRTRYVDLWSKCPARHIYVMPARPGFTQDGKTDSIEYMVAVFGRGWNGPTTLSFLDNRGKEKHKPNRLNE